MKACLPAVSTWPPQVTHPGSNMAGLAAGERRNLEDDVPATLVRTCPLCGLRYSNQPLLELHIREDHPQRERRPAPDDGDSAGAGDAGGKAADG